MWPNLPKLTIYTHNINKQFSQPMDSFTNKLTCHPYNRAESSLVWFYWGLFLGRVRRSRVPGCSWNGPSFEPGLLGQVANQLKITTRLASYTGHGFGRILWYFLHKETAVEAIWLRLRFDLVVTCHFMATHHPYGGACYIDYPSKKLSKMVGNSASYPLKSR